MKKITQMLREKKEMVDKVSTTNKNGSVISKRFVKQQ